MQHGCKLAAGATLRRITHNALFRNSWMPFGHQLPNPGGILKTGSYEKARTTKS